MKLRRLTLLSLAIPIFIIGFFPQSIFAAPGDNRRGGFTIAISLTPSPSSDITPSPSLPTPSLTQSVTPSPSVQPAPSLGSSVSPYPIPSNSPTPSSIVSPTPSDPTTTSNVTEDTPPPIPPTIYHESQVTVTPVPAVLGIESSPTPTPLVQASPTPTTAPLLQRTLPKLMNLINYGNKTDFYGQTGFTPQETRVLIFFAVLFLLTGIYLLYYKKIISLIDRIQGKISSWTSNKSLNQIVFHFHK